MRATRAKFVLIAAEAYHSAYMREFVKGSSLRHCGTACYRPQPKASNSASRKRHSATHVWQATAYPEAGHTCHSHFLASDTASFARTTRAAASSGSERSEPRRNSSFPESAEISERLKGSASATSRNADPAEAVDALWESLPIDQLRRPGEIGWDIDPDGPTGAEKFDNLWGKRQQGLNSTAIEVIGMGSWRLKPVVSPLIEFLVAHVEGAWRHLIDELGLFPLPPGWQYIDSLDPDGEYGSWSFQDLEPPKRSEAGWPRLQIENRCYQSRTFRKLHMEVAQRQDGLEVLHCVMYPWADFDLPILSMDVVAKDGDVSLAIIDPCPASMDRQLPAAYNQICLALQREYGVENNRAAPEWGQEIFSDQCLMLRPDSFEELAGFIKYSVALTRVHLRMAHNSEPIQHNKASRMRLISAAQRRYSEKQLLNSKTRRVLEAAFSPEFADEYMAGLMFDTAFVEDQKREGGSGNGSTAKRLEREDAPEDPGGPLDNGDSHETRTSVGV